MRMPSFDWVNLEWRWKKLFYAMVIIELPFTVAALALFGIADPDLYRTQLWQEGANHGWNSDPIEILYSYANYRPINTPTPWNQFITSFNVVISILSLFIMLVKVVMYITDTFPPLVSALVHATVAILYGFSISQQAASDYSDPAHPSKFPWYLTRGCGPPVNPALFGYCQQAQASFATTVCLCTLFTAYIVVAVICCFRTKEQKATLNGKLSDVESPGSTFDDKKWEMEMDQYPKKTPGTTGGLKTPMTPRTLAFNTLDGTLGSRRPNRDLPLRHHIAMGTETYRKR